MRKKRLGVFTFLLILCVMLAGCGLDGEVQGDQLNDPSDEPLEDKITDEKTGNTGEGEGAYLLEDGVFTFAMSGEYHPFNYIDEVTGELVGFDVEIGKAIAEYHGWEANPIATPFSGMISGLKSGNFDAIIGSMGITEERKEQVDFSTPYYLSGAQLFVKDDSDMTSVEDLSKEMTVGVALGTSYETVAREYSDQVATYESDVTALRDLSSSNNLDAVITDRIVGLIAIDETGFNLKQAGDLIYVEEMAIPVQKGNHELLELINEALESMFQDGTFAEISNSYFDENIGPQ